MREILEDHMNEYDVHRARIAAAVEASPLPNDVVYEIEKLWLTLHIAEVGKEALFEQGSEQYQARVTEIMEEFGGMPLGAERIELARRQIIRYYTEYYDEEVVDAVQLMFRLVDAREAWAAGWEQQIMMPSYEAAAIKVNSLLGNDLFVTGGVLELNADRARIAEERELTLRMFRP